jgi:hypothetical protein
MATTITGTTIDVNTAVLNRLSTDGTIVDLQKDGTSVGSIDSRAGVVSTIILNPASGNGAGLSGGTKTIVPADEAGIIDNDISLGISSHRFKDLYLSGGVYLGGTGAANLISDYEEGTWTPVVTGSTGTPSSITYNTAPSGTYTKTGRAVTIALYLHINAITGGSGDFNITGAPFAPMSSSGGFKGTVSMYFANSSSHSDPILQINSTSTITIGCANGANGFFSNVAWTNGPLSAFASGTAVSGTLTYFV